jgi:hypothetical protein
VATDSGVVLAILFFFYYGAKSSEVKFSNSTGLRDNNYSYRNVRHPFSISITIQRTSFIDDTVTGGQREAAAAVGPTTATGESLTAATAAAVAEAAEEEDTVAGSNPATLPGTILSPCLHYFSFLLLTISHGI